jgi:D-tyrosyl-tRNA(Tyr) deacylase
MRLVIQRVSKALVSKVNTNEVIGKIGPGLFILVGIKKGDSNKEADILAEKLTKLRIMADENGKMNLIANEFLIVSQFTLYANTSGGNRPSFLDAALPDEAKTVYEHFIKKLRGKKLKIATGSFGDYMKIDCVLDGPVTIILEI